MAAQYMRELRAALLPKRRYHIFRLTLRGGPDLLANLSHGRNAPCSIAFYYQMIFDAVEVVEGKNKDDATKMAEALRNAGNLHWWGDWYDAENITIEVRQTTAEEIQGDGQACYADIRPYDPELIREYLEE
jgi:hypothetical protein